MGGSQHVGEEPSAGNRTSPCLQAKQWALERVWPLCMRKKGRVTSSNSLFC